MELVTKTSTKQPHILTKEIVLEFEDKISRYEAAVTQSLNEEKIHTTTV